MLKANCFECQESVGNKHLLLKSCIFLYDTLFYINSIYTTLIVDDGDLLKTYLAPWSPNFVDPGTGFIEENFSTDWGQGMVLG